jgi:hypothetical protein
MNFLASALVTGEWSASSPGRYSPGIHWIGGCMGPIAGLDNVGKRKFLTLQGLELRPLSCPARSQSLYRLIYSGSYIYLARAKKKKERKIRKLFDQS